jgi:eukaryotic-like serine/threonine-protein kinase
MSSGLVIGGRFTLVRRIGGGGMGEVFEAEDNRIRRRVALKLLHGHYVKDPDVTRRFLREARAAASIDHPNSIVIHDYAQRRDGSFFIVQELLKGADLRSLLRERKRFTVAEAMGIIAPIMGALVVAHRKEVVHSDIKPENIFLADTATGQVVPKVIDYGIALAPETLTVRATTQRKALLGTLLYMAPEQATGDPIDSRVDVWAVGTVLFEMLAGECPFQAPNAFAILSKLVSKAPAPRLDEVAPDVPVALVAIVGKALAPRREERFSSMEAFLRELLAFISRTDPGFAGRHPASLPPLDEVELHSEDCIPMPTSIRGALSVRPVAHPDLEWIDQAGPTDVAPDWGQLAEQALRVNALDDAIELAERAIASPGISSERLGHMRLVQAIAGRWLGRFAEAERWTREAADTLPRGSIGWYSAIGHLAIACSSMGKHDEIPGLAGQLMRVEAETLPNGARVMGLSRVIVQLVRAGDIEIAQRASREVQAIASRMPDVEAVVQAWIDIGKAELALHFGDLTTHLQMLESAVVCFADAGDPRNACLQRANIGNAYMQLGVYEGAEAMLRDALVVGEPMKLHLIGPVQANLGFVIARLGRLDQALEVESAALDLCVRLGHHRFEVFAHIYLAEIHRLRGELSAAEEAARLGVAAALTPALRAYALATLGHMLLVRQPADALVAAREAMRTLQSLEGVEEGESLIRLVYVLALEATGSRSLALEHAREAQLRLSDRARRITERAWQRSFLERVPENARLRALVRSP